MPDEWYAHVYENKHDVVNQFLEKKEAIGRKPRTLNAYSRTLREFFHDVFPAVTPEEVTVDHIDEYVAELAGRGCAQNTKRRYLESLSAFYSWAMVRPKYDITANPARVVLEEIPKKRRERPACATWANGKKIVHHIPDPRDKVAAVVMAKTGARINEVLNLTADDVDLDRGTLTFRDRKSGKTTRNPIDVETIEALERMEYFCEPHPDGWLFTSARGARVNRERIRRAVKRAAVRAGVVESVNVTDFDKKFTPHTYRTVFTTVMRNEGMPDHFTRYLRGDKDQDEMDLYTKIDENKLRQEYLKRIKPLNI